MNYAYGVEFLELTRGTSEEQNATKGNRDALSLHGNAILTKCVLGDGLIVREPLPHTYFSDKPHRGINANGYEVRLGGRMGLFARIFEKPSPAIPETHKLTEGSFYVPEDLPPHFVVGNVHKIDTTAENRAKLWSYYGFGAPHQTQHQSMMALAQILLRLNMVLLFRGILVLNFAVLEV